MVILPVLLFYYSQLSSQNYSADIIRDYIVTEALNVGVDPQMALGVANAESQFNPEAVGDHGESFGIWQIHLPDHTDITPEQAKDPIFSTQWAMKEMKANSCTIWSTCKQVMRQNGS